ncbi:MAG: LysR family transcriptional regulator [Deltaproteobacteria bacterium]|nr:LysR family transcriptional regulator [Deltaproteobacteria bacterium]
MEIKYKIWLEHDHKVIFGKGRKELFHAIDECKSLKAAAEKLNMSYRAAWGRLKASEERLGKKIVIVDPLKRGMRLTEEAKDILTEYEKLEKAFEQLLVKSGSKLTSLMKD